MKCILPSRFLRKLFALFLVMVLIVFQNTGLLTHAAISLKPQIEVMHLPSGQTVYVQEIHTQPIVTIDTWVNTGSAQENAQNNGVSHFLQHLLFKGTEKHKLGEIDRILESRGADFNAATSADFTHYHITTASQYFQEALDLHADMLMNATIHPEELDRERKVVQEEINRSLDNPGRKAYIALMTEMFGSHPYALDTLGPKSNIQGLPRQSILDYYHRWYQPENFKTVVVGDVNAQEVFKQVNTAFEKAYREQQRPNAGKVETFPVKAITEPRSEVLGDPNLSAVQWDLGFVAPPVSNKEDNYALDIAALVLGQGTSSRLYQDVKEDKQLVDDISAGNGTRQQAGIFAISAQMKPENREKAKKAILRQLELFKAEGPTPAELEKAKTQVIKDFAFLNESTDGVAQSIGYNVTIANLDDYTEYVENIQKVDAKAVQDAARKYLNLNNAVMVEVLPGKDVKGLEQEASNNVSLLKAMAQSSPKPNTQPESKTETATTAPQVEKSVLPGGAVLLVKPTPSTQTVSFSIFAKGGRLMEPRPGVSSLASRVLMKGTEHFTAKELSQELERKGLALNASSDEDYLQVTGGSISDDFDQLISL